MKKLLFAALLGLVLANSATVRATSAESKQPCGNNGKTSGPSIPKTKDPVAVYSGNEYRVVTDLQMWGGVGEHQLAWQRWGNSRFVNGQRYFGTGHNWRHGYQWEMANAGVSASNLPQMEIVYPDGSDYIFTEDSATAATWHTTTNYGATETLVSSGNDFYLTRQNGWVYHFQYNTDDSGNVYYLMTDFKDSRQNDYVLTYDEAHEVTRVTEPGGRYLQINYTPVSINRVDFTTFARVASQPADNTLTSITVTDPTPYRYLRYISADGGNCMVGEVQFYDTNGNLLTGTVFGTTPTQRGFPNSNAFDGNLSTFADQTPATGGYVGIDLRPGHTAVVGKVSFCPRSGHESSMYLVGGFDTSSAGRFQGSNQAPASLNVIQSVTTSDGRTVSYTYTPFDDATLPYVYQTLTAVNYDDGTQATYTYEQIFPTTQPVVSSYVDPRYELAFAQAKSSYFGGVGSAVGQVQSQLNASTGEALFTIGVGSSPHFPTCTDGSGADETYSMSTGQNVETIDPTGAATYFTYDTQGFINSQKDPLGYKVSLTNSALDQPLKVTNQDGSVKTWTRDSLDLPLTFKDELGHQTTLTRDASHRVTQIAHPDGSSESFTYNGFGQPLTHHLTNGGTVQYAYDSTGLLTSETDPLGHVTSVTHDAFGRPTSVTDARGNTGRTPNMYPGRGLVSGLLAMV